MEKVKIMLSEEISPIYKEVAGLFGKQYGESRYLPWILARAMTERQAGICLALPDTARDASLGKLEVSEAFAAKVGLDKAIVEKDIYNLYEKSFLNPTRKGPRPMKTFVEWFDLQNHTKFDRELGDEYFAAIGLMLDYEWLEEKERRLGARIASGQPHVGRIIPRWKAIKDIPGIVPGEDMREILKANSLFGLIKCACRRRYKDRECDQPDEVCLVMGHVAQAAIDRGTARKISYEEAYDLITNKLANYQMVQVGTRAEDPKKVAGLICSCHADCCVVLRTPMVVGSKYPVWEHYPKSRFRAMVDPEKCLGCGQCAKKKCQFKAVQMRLYPDYDNERSWVNEELCLGCGCCVETCPSGALSMKIVEPPESLRTPEEHDFYIRT